MNHEILMPSMRNEWKERADSDREDVEEEERSFGNTLFGQAWFRKRLSTPSAVLLLQYFFASKIKAFLLVWHFTSLWTSANGASIPLTLGDGTYFEPYGYHACVHYV